MPGPNESSSGADLYREIREHVIGGLLRSLYPQQRKDADAMTIDLDRIFTHHPPKGTQPERYVAIRAKAKELAELIVANSPPSAEQTLSIRRIEEAVMYANAGIARNE